jgi:5-methylcytosine-specific restriction endonuclease McrA
MREHSGAGQTNKESNMEKFTRNCGYCYQEFQTEFETKAYCSRLHKEKAKQYRQQSRAGIVVKVYFNTCPGCQIHYSTRRSKQVYCSTECGEFQRQQLARERDKQYENQRTPSFKRRIYFKSEGHCGICGEWIDLREKHPSKKSMSVDHIVPRAKGGSHSFDNLQAAHLGCNERKSDRPHIAL